MRNTRPTLRLLAPALLAVGLSSGSARATLPAAYGDEEAEVLVEGGAFVPFGDLADSHVTPLGFGAGLGYEVGFRLRAFLPEGWAVSPSFTYSKPKSYSAMSSVIGEFTTSTSTYRYGLDIQRFYDARAGAPRFFVTGGVAIVRNRMREDYADGTYFEGGVTSFAAVGGAGVRYSDFEFSVQYVWDRFTTPQFWDGDNKYSWDALSVRLGIALPGSF